RPPERQGSRRAGRPRPSRRRQRTAPRPAQDQGRTRRPATSPLHGGPVSHTLQRRAQGLLPAPARQRKTRQGSTRRRRPKAHRPRQHPGQPKPDLDPRTPLTINTDAPPPPAVPLPIASRQGGLT